MAAPGRHPMALQPPQSLDPLPVDPPVLTPKQRPHAPVPPARVRGRELVHPRHQPQLVLRRHQLVALRRAMLPDKLTRPTLRHPPPLHQKADGVASARRAHQFPRCRSRSIEISSACSATIFFKRLLSCSNFFNPSASPPIG